MGQFESGHTGNEALRLVLMKTTAGGKSSKDKVASAKTHAPVRPCCSQIFKKILINKERFDTKACLCTLAIKKRRERVKNGIVMVPWLFFFRAIGAQSRMPSTGSLCWGRRPRPSLLLLWSSTCWIFEQGQKNTVLTRFSIT